ncbi:transketolase [Brachybacterium halotolerans subsp. kimchii]|uniref:transketolase n=1 Tax=Brachybacterium halotolerans TaxID=2795215 RepID=UPI001E4CCABF|nr:transketolase [Brachybacterium halotolerans]UEJ83254.1 transketolase [Brachybacterium halotolerans subsp. kimchii]
MSESFKGIDGWTDVDKRAIDTVRTLAADAVQKVGNGHPGTAISLAPAAYLLYQDIMRHDPSDTGWLGRDRFVLSAGHSSLTQYIQLYLGGFGLELEDIESLRTWGSKTPGHPEVGHTKGVETTTGPLGQGLATAVGMAMAQRRERGLFDPEAPAGESPFDRFTFAIASDGDMQEGVTNEASSIAGTQELGNLIVLWDDNDISIEGHTDIAFTEDTAARYEALGWDVHRVDWTNGGTQYVEDVAALKAAIEDAKKVTDKPSFIALRTVIAWPAPTKQGTGASHGSALGDEEVAGLKKALGLDPEKTFDVPAEVLDRTRELVQRGKEAHAAWDEKLASWREANADRAALLDRLVAGDLPDGWADALPVFEADAKGLATRAASGKVLNALAPVLPELWGGSADLAGSNNTTMDGEPSFIPAERSTKEFSGDEYGRTLHFGIREHAMGAILSGINLDDLTRAYGGTFLQFSDYMRGAVRLSALMGVDNIYVWTHDSIGLGEDGPTHQPVEHLAALRAIPGLDVVRPADANETAAAWKATIERRERPIGLILSRQALPTLDRGEYASADGVARGGYVLKDAGSGEPEVILIATGSEVQYAVEAQKQLEESGTPTRVVSMPSVEWFEDQDEAYRESVLPRGVRARVSVEAGIAQSWFKYLGDAGRAVSLEHYGASADAATLFREYGFTADAVVAAAKESIEAARS